MKKVFKFLSLIILVVVITFVLFLIYAIANDYEPEGHETVYLSDTSKTLADTVEYKLMIWNIGYCGLDKSMDFFYDGGNQVFTKESQYLENLDKITTYITAKSKNTDFILLQEVDTYSKRSYYINQVDTLNKKMPEFLSFFAKNYDVFFVPTPISKPYSSVTSGLLTLTPHEPQIATRFSFPGRYSFPVYLFMLDRCFLENRYNLANGKQLLIINTHNEAYDDGSQRKQQMAFLKDYLLSEYAKGNYIIVGGDWNQCPPKFENKFNGYLMDMEDKMDIPEDYLAEWKWLHYDSIPTNRRIKYPFDKAKSLTTVIDFYLLSPNIDALNIMTDDLEFENSDHQPVFLTIKLK